MRFCKNKIVILTVSIAIVNIFSSCTRNVCRDSASSWTKNNTSIQKVDTSITTNNNEKYGWDILDNNEQNVENEILIYAEKMPEFPGGEKELNKFINKNLQYPLQKDIKGTVYCNFVVDTNGVISNIKILIGIGEDFDKEAIRVIKKMPKWNSGLHYGKKVKVYSSLVIKF